LILLHGFTEANSSWFELARSLEKEYDLILPDLLGHGNSDRLTAGEGVDLQQDLAELIAGLGLQKTALLGHSLGALTAAQFAARLETALAETGDLDEPTRRARAGLANRQVTLR